MPALLDMAQEAFRRAKQFAEDPATGAMDTGMGLLDLLGRPGNAVRSSAVQAGRDFNSQPLPQAGVDIVDLLNPQTLPQYMARHPDVMQAGAKGLTGEVRTDATELPGMSNLPDEGPSVGPVHLTPRTVAGFAAGSALDPLTYAGPGLASGKGGQLAIQALLHGLGGLQGAELVGRDPDTGEVDPGRALAGLAAGLAVPHVPGLIGKGARGLGSEPVRTFVGDESGALKMGAGAQRLREAAIKRKMASLVGNPETPEPRTPMEKLAPEPEPEPPTGAPDDPKEWKDYNAQDIAGMDDTERAEYDDWKTTQAPVKFNSYDKNTNWLSNFSPHPVGEFPTVEHAYQAAKTDIPAEIEAIRAAPNAAAAKKLGRTVTVKAGWNQAAAQQTMLDLLRQKFGDNPELKQQLLATGDRNLVHDAPWGDTFWGVDKNGEGQNMQGEMLMQIRNEIRSGVDRAPVETPQDPGPNPYEGRSYTSMSKEEDAAYSEWARKKMAYDDAQKAPTGRPSQRFIDAQNQRLQVAAQRPASSRPEGAAPQEYYEIPYPGQDHPEAVARAQAANPPVQSQTPQSASQIKTYTGIGSRETPEDVQSLMTRVAAKLKSQGYTLRSGAAPGADSAFEAGAGGQHEVYLPWRGFEGRSGEGYIDAPTSEAEAMAAEHHPNWDNLSQGARKLHARNSHQVMGSDLNSPSQFVLAWTPGGQGGGGTGQAIRLAKAKGVQVLDLGDPEVLARMQKFVGDEPGVSGETPPPVEQAPPPQASNSRMLRANMNFPFKGQARPEVTAKNTFDAIKNGERTATTRFDAWQGTEKWANAKPGDTVEFTSADGEKLHVRVKSVDRVDMGAMSPDQLEAWSKAEGWSVDHAKGYANREEPGHRQGYQIHFEYLPEIRPDALAEQAKTQQLLNLPKPEPTDAPFVAPATPEEFPERYDWQDPSLRTGSKKIASRGTPPPDPRPGTQLTDLPPGEGIEATKRDAFERAYREGLSLDDTVYADPDTGELVSTAGDRLPVDDSPLSRPDKQSPFASATTRLVGRDYPADEQGNPVAGPPQRTPLGAVKGEESTAAGLAESLAAVGKARTNETRKPDAGTLEGARYHAANAARAEQLYQDELNRVGGDPTKSRFYTDKLDAMARATNAKRDPRTGEPIPLKDDKGNVVTKPNDTPGLPDVVQHEARTPLYRRVEAGDFNTYRSRVKRPPLEPGWQNTDEGTLFLRSLAADMLRAKGTKFHGMAESDVADAVVRQTANDIANTMNADNPANPRIKDKRAGKKQWLAGQDEANMDTSSVTDKASLQDDSGMSITDPHQPEGIDMAPNAGSGDVDTSDYGGRNYSQARKIADPNESQDAYEHRQLSDQIAKDRKYLDSLGDDTKEHGYLKPVYDKKGNPVLDKEGRPVKTQKIFTKDELAKQIEVAQTRIDRAEKRLKTLEPAPAYDENLDLTTVRQPESTRGTGRPKTFASGSETVAPELAAERAAYQANAEPPYKAKNEKSANPQRTKELDKFVEDYINAVNAGLDHTPHTEARPRPTLEDRYGRADYAEPDSLIRLLQQQRAAGRQGSAAPPIPNIRLREMLRSIGLAA